MRALALSAAVAVGVAGAAAAGDLVIEVAGKGAVEIELFEDAAPLHAERLRSLAGAGAFDGVAFHRVIDGFMAQTGDVQHGRIEAYDPRRAGTGGSDLPDLPAEFSDVPFERGVVGMARTQDPDSANSQFFIMFARAPHLDGQYTAVGRVTEGMDVVDGLARGAGPGGAVAEPDHIESMTPADD
jgi:peptidylprolyl isomerase